MHVRVTVGGRLPEAKAVAAELMAELAELDRSVHVSAELGKAAVIGFGRLRAGISEAAKRKREEFLAG